MYWYSSIEVELQDNVHLERYYVRYSSSLPFFYGDDDSTIYYGNEVVFSKGKYRILTTIGAHAGTIFLRRFLQIGDGICIPYTLDIPDFGMSFVLVNNVNKIMEQLGLRIGVCSIDTYWIHSAIESGNMHPHVAINLEEWLNHENCALRYMCNVEAADILYKVAQFNENNAYTNSYLSCSELNAVFGFCYLDVYTDILLRPISLKEIYSARGPWECTTRQTNQLPTDMLLPLVGECLSS